MLSSDSQLNNLVVIVLLVEKSGSLYSILQVSRVIKEQSKAVTRFSAELSVSYGCLRTHSFLRR